MNSGIANKLSLEIGASLDAATASAEAERSGVLQGCLPSANCSAGARADALSNSLISSVVPRETAVGRHGLKYKTILCDPPWQQTLVGKFKVTRHSRADRLPYPTMTLKQIKALPIGDLADKGAHLWLWTTNEFLEAGFAVMRHWGFKYLAPITWQKPSGCGAWFVHRTQTMLFGYRSPLRMCERYKPTILEAGCPREHSVKPLESYQLIEAVSEAPRIEIFARPWTQMFPRRDGWSVWGNEVPQDVALVPSDACQCNGKRALARNGELSHSRPEKD